MTESEFRSALKEGVSGGYLFFGDEDFLKAHYRAQLRCAVLGDCPDELREFNRSVITMEDGDASPLADAIAMLPMMSERRIVEFIPEAPGSFREKEKKAVLAALATLSEAPETVLVMVLSRDAIDPGTKKKPNPFFRELCKLLTPVEFPLQTGARLRRWVLRHFETEHIYIADRTLEAFLSRSAPDMLSLSGEIRKLIAFAHAAGKTEINEDDVRRVTSPGLREDAFALANAILAGNKTAALSALDVYRKRREEPMLVLASVSRVMTDLLTVARLVEGGEKEESVTRAMKKMHPYTVKLYITAAKRFGGDRLSAALDALLVADRKMKTMSLGYIPLERFLCTMGEEGEG